MACVGNITKGHNFINIYSTILYLYLIAQLNFLIYCGTITSIKDFEFYVDNKFISNFQNQLLLFFN